ncbi:hypothetical protein F4778DRAFT_667418 [Xylariomycetidae sp. FL2044]|nr:hypothetical protein F4778DRAFT_667418 [Xylariomycetidae sp. FL2044]
MSKNRNLQLPVEHGAIFSPSVARAAASTAKEWSYIDNWLKTKYRALRQRPPAFERNPETLSVLLALASANEAADEERASLVRVEEVALQEIEAAERDKAQRRSAVGEDEAEDADIVAEDMLNVVENGLTKEGKTAIDAMAEMAVELGVAYPEPQDLAARFVELQGRSSELEMTIKRVHMLQAYLDTESDQLETFIQELQQSPEYQPADDLTKKNLDLQRKVADLTAKLPELKRHVDALKKAIANPNVTVEEVRKDEEAYLAILAKKKERDAQVKEFAGLPPDVEAARVELEALRSDLQDVTEKRDANFEMLVERESPVKVRKKY